MASLAFHCFDTVLWAAAGSDMTGALHITNMSILYHCSRIHNGSTCCCLLDVLPGYPGIPVVEQTLTLILKCGVGHSHFKPNIT